MLEAVSASSSIFPNDCVVTVGPNDDGTFYNPETDEIISGGFVPTAESCARSIDERKTSNEWLIRRYRPIAIFAFEPIWVRHPLGGDVPMDRDTVFGFFSKCRIFSGKGDQFVEFDPDTRTWKPVTYDTIMGATPHP
jgi:hypothetical protein